MFEALESKLGLNPGAIRDLSTREEPRYSKIVFKRRPNWRRLTEFTTRTLWAPCEELKIVQRRIGKLISDQFEPHPIAHAYATGRSVVTNAKQHVGKAWVLQIDLVDFFGSITEAKVIEGLAKALPQFNQGEIAVIGGLCCRDGYLPQGAPSSPILSNLVCSSFDNELWDFATSAGLTVTRFSDDIPLSSPTRYLPPEIATVHGRGLERQIKLGRPLSDLFKQHGFEINSRKLKYQRKTDRQQINGIIVNDGLSLPDEYHRYIRMTLHIWEQYGLDAAVRNFRPYRSTAKFVAALNGRIAYIRQVRGREDSRYKSLRSRFTELKARDKGRISPSVEASPNVANVINGSATQAFAPRRHASAPRVVLQCHEH